MKAPITSSAPLVEQLPAITGANCENESDAAADQTSHTKHITAILFDIDHTLVNLSDIHSQSYHETFQEIFGVEGYLQDIAPSGKTTPNIFREVGQLHGLDTYFIESNLEAAISYLTALSELRLNKLGDQVCNYLLPGVPQILDALEKRGFTLGIMSGNPSALGKLVLQSLHLLEYFSLFNFGDEAATRPDLARLALARLRQQPGLTDLAPSQLLVIGDAPGDIQAAQAIGATSMAVATGIHLDTELALLKPHLLFTNLADTDSVVETVTQFQIV